MIEPILSGRALVKRFRGLVAVDKVDFDIPEGAIYGLIGPNGAGKSTLFNLVTGYDHPSEGEIRFLGEPIGALATYRRNQLGIARAFQITRPFPAMSVRENVEIGAMFGRRHRDGVAAVTNRALMLAGLTELADHPALGLTIGALRKLEIARAVATRPRLLLADEPCAGLNPSETEDMTDCLRRIRDGGVTIWLVEHDMRAVMRICDRIVVMEAGRKIADGLPRDIISDARVIEAYLGSEIDDDNEV